MDSNDKTLLRENRKYNNKKNSKLSKRLQSKHSTQNLHKCNKCARFFSTKPGLNRHFKRCGLPHHIRLLSYRKEFFCDHCNFKTHYKENLPFHFQAKHSSVYSNIYMCSKCGKNYSNQRILRDHSKVCGKQKDYLRLPMKFSCHHCNYKAHRKPTLTQHIRVKHLPRDFSVNNCKKCGKNYQYRSDLLQHIKNCGQPKNLRRFGCEYCGHRSYRKTLLAEHIQAKHLPYDPNLNKCGKCEKAFSSKSNLRRHLKICSNFNKDLPSKIELRRFSCDHCDYRAMNKASVALHIQAMHLPRDFKSNNCSKCKKNFSTHGNLRAHEKMCGMSEFKKLSFKRFSCDHCMYKTFTKSVLANHIKSKHLPQDSSSNRCEECGKNYSSSRSLFIHKRDIHLPRDPNVNKCKKCEKNFSNPSNLLAHSKTCGQSKDLKLSLKRFICDYCKFRTSRKYFLADHIQTKHLPKNLNLNKCQKCEKNFSSRLKLTQHVRKIHSSQNRNFKTCNKCKKNYKLKVSLIKHLEICGKTKDLIRSVMQFSCDHCQFKTRWKNDLVGHIQAKHLPRDSNFNKCLKCGKSFSYKGYLKKHNKICGKTKNYVRSLKRFTCDHCDYKSLYKSILMRHIDARHSQDKQPNNCAKCKKIFYNKESFKQHVKNCGLPKVFYFCDHCDYKTDGKGNLVRHVKIKHLPRNLKENKCKICGKYFSCRGSLLRHNKICVKSE